MNKFFVTLLCVISFQISLSQQIINGSISTRIDNIVAAMPGPGTNQFQEPSTAQMTLWSTLIQDILARSYSKADSIAPFLGYKLYHYIDNSIVANKDYYLLEKDSASSNYWGTYIFADTALRPFLCIEAPHAMADINTEKEAMWCYQYLDAKVLAISGTHPCNHDSISTCSGKTVVCDTTNVLAPFKISNMSHNTNNIFYTTTEALNTFIPNVVIVHFHGFTPDTNDPDIILSNGTHYYPPGFDYCVLLKNALQILDTGVVCKISHVNLIYSKGISMWDTHGRYLNYSTTPCKKSSTTPSGKFVFIDQDFTKMRSTFAGWDLMAHALEIVFPVASPLPVQLVQFRAYTNKSKNINVTWSVYEDENTELYVLEKSNDAKNYTPIYNVSGIGKGELQTFQFTDKAPFANANYYRLSVFDKLKAKQMYYATCNNNVSENSIIVWSNYAAQQLSIAIDGDGSVAANIQIFDISGKLIYEINNEFENGIMQINSTFLNNYTGIILIKATINDEIKTAKIFYSEE